MIIIYTGNGKGKTSASTGQAIRAIGQNKKVAFGQFFKPAHQAGEQKILAELLDDNFFPHGCGFYFGEEEKFAQQRSLALELLNWAKAKAGKCFMLVLDEALYALDSKLLSEQELKGLVELCRENNTHLVLSGRGLPAWLVEEADLISEINEIKHPFYSGQKAQAGIEF